MKVSGFCGGAIAVGLFWEYIDIALCHTQPWNDWCDACKEDVSSLEKDGGLSGGRCSRRADTSSQLVRSSDELKDLRVSGILRANVDDGRYSAGTGLDMFCTDAILEG